MQLDPASPVRHCVQPAILDNMVSSVMQTGPARAFVAAPRPYRFACLCLRLQRVCPCRPPPEPVWLFWGPGWLARWSPAMLQQTSCRLWQRKPRTSANLRQCWEPPPWWQTCAPGALPLARLPAQALRLADDVHCGAQAASALTYDEIQGLTYLQVKGSGIANTCPVMDGGSSNLKDLKPGNYTINKFCLEPTSFTVKEESQFKGGDTEFVKTKLMTRLTYTLDEVRPGAH